MAFLASWWRPATLAAHTGHLSLRWAFAFHVLALSVSCAVLLAIPGLSLSIGTWDRNELVVLAALTIVSIEGGFLLLGLMLTAWGARVEPLRKSFANGLRCVWLQTAHLPVAILAIGLVVISVEDAARDWRAQVPVLSPPVDPGPQATEAERQQYNEAINARVAQNNAAWEAWQERRPLLVRYDDEIFFVSRWLVCIWFLWGVLRAIGASRGGPQAPAYPMCDFCGYNLTATPIEARCPECGRPAMASLGEGARPGTDWQRRREIDRIPAWVNCSLQAIFRPTAFGRGMRILDASSDHRRFAPPAVLAAGVAAALGFVLFVIAVEGIRALSQTPWLFEVSLVLGSIFAPLALLGSVAAATVAGTIYCVREKRNLMPAAIQAACYLLPFVAAALAWAFLSGSALIANSHSFGPLARLFNADAETVVFFIWAVQCLALFIWHAVLLGRIIAATRYASR